MTTEAEQHAKAIRADMRRRLTTIGRRLGELSEARDEEFPPEFRLKRSQERDSLVREWVLIESQFNSDMQQWADTQRNTAERLRSSDPVLDAAHESRRVAENLEIAGLAQPFIGAGRTAIKSNLHEEAKRFLALDMPDRARIFLEASKRAGFEDPKLVQAYEEALDRTVPARRQAHEIEMTAQDQVDLFDNDRYSMRLVYRVGNQVRASTAAKMLAARRGERTPVGMVGGEHGAEQLERSAKDAGTSV